MYGKFFFLLSNYTYLNIDLTWREFKVDRKTQSSKRIPYVVQRRMSPNSQRKMSLLKLYGLDGIKMMEKDGERRT